MTYIRAYKIDGLPGASVKEALLAYGRIGICFYVIVPQILRHDCGGAVDWEIKSQKIKSLAQEGKNIKNRA